MNFKKCKVVVLPASRVDKFLSTKMVKENWSKEEVEKIRRDAYNEGYNEGFSDGSN